MKRIIYSSLILLCTVSCAYPDPKPIEKYQGQVLVIVYEPARLNRYRTILTVKNKDSVFDIHITPFDAQNLKVGDTIN